MVPTILFGAFDRHNFGDLLFPHIAAALLPGRELVFAGLAARDLRPCGGHELRALAGLAAAMRGRPVNILHTGGEVLDCDVWEAAVMLLLPRVARQTIARLDADPQRRIEWAQRKLGLDALVPYVTGRELFPEAAAVIHNAVGGIGLGARDPAMRAEVRAKLAAADRVGVRDRHTRALLGAAGIACNLMPDPAVMTAELFGERIRLRAREGETARVRQAFPQGYLAVQFSADFGDDETLAEIAAQLDRSAFSTGCGIAFFRAGAAPWHDDLRCYRRVAARMRTTAVKIFASLDLWDICALIACGRGYCGSSLHGRIIALAFGLPRVGLLHPQAAQVGKRMSKQWAFADAWEQEDMPAAVDVHQIADGIRESLSSSPDRRLRLAADLAACYREEFEAVRKSLE